MIDLDKIIEDVNVSDTTQNGLIYIELYDDRRIMTQPYRRRSEPHPENFW